MTNEFHEEVENKQENTQIDETIIEESIPEVTRQGKKKRAFRSGFVGGE